MKVSTLLFPMVLLVAMGTAYAAESGQASESGQMSFDQLDADGDGMVTRDEAAVDPSLEESFDQLDANADGLLSNDEIGMGGPGTEEEPSQTDESGSDTGSEY